MYTSSFLHAVLMAAPLLSSMARAHSWVERLNVIAGNGTMIGAPGFPRGNVLRSAPNFGDTLMVNLIPPNGGAVNVIDAGQSMCRDSQNSQTQTNGSPRLSAAPGAFVALRYQENGHVTLPQNQPGKPDNRGTNFVYYTTQSKSIDKFLGIHRQWTPDGKGGDGRGRLISTQNFDDGQCYQINPSPISTQRRVTYKHTADSLMGADLWCQQDVQIPTDAPVGSTVTLYWVWDWPTMPGTAGFPSGKQEIYTTCMDIDIVAGTSAVSKALASQIYPQDYVSAAAVTQFPTITNPTAVVSPKEIPFSGGSTPASSATAASSAVQASSSAVASSVVSVTALYSVASLNTSPATVTVYMPSTVTVISIESASSATSSLVLSSPASSTPSLTSSSMAFSSGAASLSSSSSSVATSLASSPITQGMSSSTPDCQHDMPAASSSSSAAINSSTALIQFASGLSASIPVVTQTSVDFVTTTAYNTIVVKREIGCDSTESNLVAMTSSSSPCSKTEAVYRMRARMPFYALSELEPHLTRC